MAAYPADDPLYSTEDSPRVATDPMNAPLPGRPVPQVDPNQVVASLSPAGIAAQTGVASLSNFGAGPGIGVQSYQSSLPPDFATGPGIGVQAYNPPTETQPWPEQVLEDNPELPTDPNFENAFVSPSRLTNDQVATISAQVHEDKMQNANDAIKQAYPSRPVPPIGQSPQTPESIMRHAIGMFANPLMLLAAVGGASTKLGARGALAAMTGVMEGMNQQDWQKTYLQQNKFRNSVKETALSQQLEIADVNSELNSNKPDAEKMQGIAAIAEQHQDQFLARLAKAGDSRGVYDWRDNHQKVADKLDKATRRYGKGQERVAKDKEAQSDLDDEAKSIMDYKTDPPPSSSKRYGPVMNRVFKLAKERGETYDERKAPKHTSGGRYGAAPEDVSDTVQGMQEGKIPPFPPARGKGQYFAEAERRDFNLSDAQREWAQMQKQISSLNSERMIRNVATAKQIISTIDEAKRLTKEMDLGGIAILNKGQLAAYANLQGNSPNGILARNYLQTINAVKEEMATLLQGGYAPTLPVWELVNQQLRAEDGAKQMLSGLDQVQKLITYRLNATPNLNVLGPGAPSRYIPGSGETKQTPAPQFTGRTANGGKFRETTDGRWLDKDGNEFKP